MAIQPLQVALYKSLTRHSFFLLFIEVLLDKKWTVFLVKHVSTGTVLQFCIFFFIDQLTYKEKDVAAILASFEQKKCSYLQGFK